MTYQQALAQIKAIEQQNKALAAQRRNVYWQLEKNAKAQFAKMDGAPKRVIEAIHRHPGHADGSCCGADAYALHALLIPYLR
jgi:hypothetical protein